MQVLPHLLASLVHHCDWLTSTLSPAHPIFSAPVFTQGSAYRLKGKTITGVAFDDVEMRASGIPPHMVISVAVDKMQLKMEQDNFALKALWESGIEKISTIALSVPALVETRLREEFTIEGVHAVSRRDVQNAIHDLEQVSLRGVRV